MPTVSVIIPNYNHAPYLQQRIDSVLNQSYQDFELIILDDCSADSSREIIDRYASGHSRITTYYNSANSGSACRQWDYGAAKARGEFLWIAESDDFAEPDFLAKTTAVLNGRPEVGLVYCNSKVLDERKKVTFLASDWRTKHERGKWAADYSNKGISEIAGHMFRNNTINNVSAVLFRKRSYMEAGLADHGMKYCGDWFLYLRILTRADIAYIAEPLNTLRLHASSSLHDYYRASSFLHEFLRIYAFILAKIKVPVKNKAVMAKNILAIICKKTIHGSFPCAGEIREALRFLLAAAKS